MPINIIEEWPALLPSKIVDGRAKLVRHKKKVWTKRDIAGILGICNHQVAGGDNPVETAKYHVKYFPADSPGAPGLCYTFYIRKNGEVWWCNDIEDATWSQGYAGRPGSENEAFVSIVCGGDFPGPGYHAGSDKLTIEQKTSLLETWAWLLKHLNLQPRDLFGHKDFGKPPCPGHEISALMDAYALERSAVPATMPIVWWQSVLVKLGYSLGKTGPQKNGVDGDWGGRSRAAITKFQKAHSLFETGYRDDSTLYMLIHVLKEKGIVVPVA